MSKMKYSGVEWIGDIPSKWKIKKLKYLYKIGIGLTHTPEYVDNGVPFISVKDISSGFLNMDNVKYIAESEFKTFPSSAIPKKGEIIFGRVGTIGCPIIFEENQQLGMFVSVGKLKNISPNIIYNKYFYYWMKSSIFEHETKQFVTGTAQLNLNTDWISNYRVIVPNINEQRLIANFLEEKTTNLDNILFDLNKQIEILTSYKKSIITETVIGGLNKNVKMIASGFNWAKEVPAHWDVTKKIKSLFDFSNGLPITKADLIENGIPVISYGQIHSKTNKGTFINTSLIRFVDEKYLKQNGPSIVKEGDFIFADTSEDIDGCGNCVYINTNELLFAGYHSIILRSKYSNHNKYLAYLFLTDNWRSQIRSKVYGVKVFSVTQKILKEAKIILPPENEQKEIADYLDRKCEQIDKIIEEKQKQIEKIEEYKKSVIYEYVTGKKRVEGAEELYG